MYSSLPGLTRQSMMNCRMKSYWIYVLASRPRGTLYVGMTSDLVPAHLRASGRLSRRLRQRTQCEDAGLYEQHAIAINAIQREKNIKHWPRK
jgi:putative endonuclease